MGPQEGRQCSFGPQRCMNSILRSTKEAEQWIRRPETWKLAGNEACDVCGGHDVMRKITTEKTLIYFAPFLTRWWNMSGITEQHAVDPAKRFFLNFSDHREYFWYKYCIRCSTSIYLQLLHSKILGQVISYIISLLFPLPVLFCSRKLSSSTYFKLYRDKKLLNDKKLSKKIQEEEIPSVRIANTVKNNLCMWMFCILE